MIRQLFSLGELKGKKGLDAWKRLTGVWYVNPVRGALKIILSTLKLC